jgi:hypothetical protein
MTLAGMLSLMGLSWLGLTGLGLVGWKLWDRRNEKEGVNSEL